MEMVTALKAGAFAVKNRKSIGKSILIAALVLAAFLSLILLSLMSLLSVFSGDGVLKSPENMDVTQTAVYKSLEQVMTPYYDELKDQMKDIKSQIEEEHVYEITVYDEQGNPSKQTRCSAAVTRKLNYVADAAVLSYLICSGGIDDKTAAINGQMAREFLNRVSEIKTEQSGNDVFVITNEILDVDEIAEIYFQDEKTRKKFKEAYTAYSQYFLVNESKVVGDEGEYIPDEAVLLSVPLYLQYKNPWGTAAYGNGTISRNGCCPTCLAMVFSYLRQENIYPDDITGWVGNKYYVNGAGTAWSIFEPASEHWNVKCTNIGKDENAMMSALGEGKPVIASMGPGTFTKGGHFIVLTGVTVNGKIKVNDPNDSAKKNHVNMEFAPSLIMRETKNMWVFE